MAAIKRNFKRIEGHRIDLDNVMAYNPIYHHNKTCKYIEFYMLRGSDIQVWFQGNEEEKAASAVKNIKELDIIFFGKSEEEEKLFE